MYRNNSYNCYLISIVGTRWILDRYRSELHAIRSVRDRILNNSNFYCDHIYDGCLVFFTAAAAFQLSFINRLA